MFGRDDYRRLVMIGPPITEDQARCFLKLHYDSEKIADFYPKSQNPLVRTETA